MPALRSTVSRLLVPAVLAAIASLGATLPATAPAFAADAGYAAAFDVSESATRRVSLGINKSLIIELPVDAKDVLVSSPAIADAVMRSTRRAFLIGVEVGHTNVFFFDAAGRTILSLDVTVERDLGALETTLARLMPESSIAIEGVGDSVVLSGEVADAGSATKAAELAARFVDDAEKVVNLLKIRGGDQVLLKVTVAEIQRNIAKQLGIDLTRQFDIGGTGINLSAVNPFGLTGNPPSRLGRLFNGSRGCSFLDTVGQEVRPIYDPSQFEALSGCDLTDGTLRALEQNGMLRTLAEPTLTAISGESASFLAGGEFPIITGFDPDTRTPTVEFKKFGVSLGFTPVVLSGGKISLKVTTEVSELSREETVVIAGSSIPGLQVRRADTTIELPSGGSMAVAGLIKDDVKQVIAGVPGAMKLPILGSLFKSREYQRNQTELVVIVTPFLAKPVHRDQIARPDDGFETSNDFEAILLGRTNKRRDGNSQPVPASGYRGSYGFIVD